MSSSRSDVVTQSVFFLSPVSLESLSLNSSNGVTGELKRCFKEVSRMFQRSVSENIDWKKLKVCLKKVSRVFQESFKMFQESLKGVSIKIIRCLEGDFRVFQGSFISFKDVSTRVFPEIAWRNF